jgi:hypothetical protein
MFVILCMISPKESSRATLGRPWSSARRWRLAQSGSTATTKSVARQVHCFNTEYAMIFFVLEHISKGISVTVYISKGIFVLVHRSKGIFVLVHISKGNLRRENIY